MCVNVCVPGCTLARRFWEEETEHSPEARIAMHKHQEAVKKAEENKKNPPKKKKQRRYFRGETAMNSSGVQSGNFFDICF